jgi:hypothetical protein
MLASTMDARAFSWDTVIPKTSVSWSRPAEWCNWSRVGLRGGGVLSNYDAISAGCATSFAVSGWLVSWAMEASDR